VAVAVTDRGRPMLGSRVRSSEWDAILNTGLTDLTEYILMRIVASSSAISWNSGTTRPIL